MNVMMHKLIDSKAYECKVPEINEVKGCLISFAADNMTTGMSAARVFTVLSNYKNKKLSFKHAEVVKLLLENENALIKEVYHNPKTAQTLSYIVRRIYERSLKGDEAVRLNHYVQQLIRNIEQESHKLRSEHRNFDKQLSMYNDRLAASPNQDTIKEIDQFIRENLKWFYHSSKPAQILGFHSTDKSIGQLLSWRKKLQKTSQAGTPKQEKLVLKLTDLITRIVPKPQFPDGIVINIYQYLPATSVVEIQNSLDKIRALGRENVLLGSKSLAAWISHHQLAIQDLNLSAEELDAMAPYLTHLNIGTYLEWDNAKYNHFIQSCTRLKSLNIYTPRITHLPDHVRRLTHLNCSGCSALTALPAGMNVLEELDCSDCVLLHALPLGLNALKKLNCFGCALLATLPAQMKVLKYLNCSACPRLASLSNDMGLLQTLICKQCPMLEALPQNMNNLQILDCSQCGGLLALPKSMPALEKLNCSNCGLLTELPLNMKVLRELICSYCIALTILPNGMSALELLNCNFCVGLTSLPLDINALKFLHCMFCTGLRELSLKLNALLILNCKSCIKLTSLPKTLPALRKLYIRGCRALIVPIGMRSKVQRFKL